MEEVGETMHQENLKAEKRKKEIAALMEAEKDAFLKARRFWKEKRREVLKQEHDEILRIIAKREALQKREAEGKADTQAAKDAMLEKMMSKLMEEEHKRIEREEISRELYLVEKERKLAGEAIKLAMKKKRTARQQLEEMAKTQRAVAERKAKENAIDAAFAKYLADERKKQEEKEGQKEQARREKVVQYGNELREAIEQNKTQRSKDAGKIRREIDINETKCHSESNLEAVKFQQAKNNVL
ncbi:meiosis-specific nuclear structural protein 1-like [Bombus huntii]|uniref:meiosis-specific nuclear structural protein 1-like n=1 Tax=Bombus huntii TaxID=85661 RepID=UPI0021AA08CC|nr:meiosis-specific nuclear structural protein 1-like [Bombus huntii]